MAFRYLIILNITVEQWLKVIVGPACRSVAVMVFISLKKEVVQRSTVQSLDIQRGCAIMNLPNGDKQMEDCESRWNQKSVSEKIEYFEDKILGHLDECCQAFDLEEIMVIGFNPKDRLYCWNAAMNLIEQGRVHVIQIREKFHPDNLRWLIVGFKYEILCNEKFHPPGKVVKV